MIAPGEKLSRYHLREPLGSGGMSCVYRAYDPVLDREVAIKMLPPELARDAVLRERFQEEARALGRVEHPNLIRLFAVGQEGLVNFYAMELITGKSLKDVIAAVGRLTIAETLAVMGQALNALAAVHGARIVHRDFKPGNIMLDVSGRVVLMDFGLARRAERQNLTAVGAVLGTPEYMSPEQARGEKADERSDLYAVGAVLYEMLAGRPPFGGKDTIAILRQHVQAVPPPLRQAAPGTPPELERIVARLLAKKPEARYPHVAELLADLGKLTPAGLPKASDSAVRELLARAAQAVSRPTQTSAGGMPKAAAARTWESPTARRGDRLRTWVAVIAAAAAVVSLIVALIALFSARARPAGLVHGPATAATAPSAAATWTPAAGTTWLVIERDRSEFTGEFVALAAGPGNETQWVFFLPDGEFKFVPTSKIRTMTQKGGEGP